MIFLYISITIEEKDTDFSFFKSFLFMNPDDLSIQIERLHAVTTYPDTEVSTGRYFIPNFNFGKTVGIKELSCSS